MLNGIISNINSLFSRGKVTLIDNAEALQVQQVELHKGQVRSEIYAPQQYGIETAPHVGADTICLFKGGSVENGYVVQTFDPRYKPLDIEDGDTYLYTKRNKDVAIEGINPKEVHRIWFSEKDGKILIETDETVQIVCKDADIDVSHDATINVDNDVTAVIGNNLTATVALNTTLTTTTCNLNVLGTMAVVCPATTWLGNIVLTGNILQTGSITSTDDHVAGTISLQGHVHAGDGGTGSGPDTGAPL
tara:strand:+ start:31 stop:771 length:741 start_codon:yes stop_codon:yes gene_type:complete